MMKRRDFLGIAPALLLGLPQLSYGAAEYPSKPIRLVVPFPPGGGADTLSRLVSAKLTKELGQTIVVENMAGAGGTIGASSVARARNDGYTLLYGTNGTHAINPTLYKNPVYDHLKDFASVSRFTEIACIVCVRPNLGVNSIEELIELSKAKPDSIMFASAGNGTTSHLAGVMFCNAAGLKWTHVPYRGGAAAVTDLIGERVDVLIDLVPNTGPHVAGKRIKGLAVTTAERIEAFPDLASLNEVGLSGFNVTAWDGLFAPAGTPKEVIDKLNRAVHLAFQDADLLEQLRTRASIPAPQSAEEFEKFIVSESQRWGEAVKSSGAVIE